MTGQSREVAHCVCPIYEPCACGNEPPLKPHRRSQVAWVVDDDAARERAARLAAMSVRGG